MTVKTKAARGWLVLACAAALLDAKPALPRGLAIAGGCAGWTRSAALAVRGVREADGLRGPFSALVDTRDGRSATQWRAANISGGAGFDGARAWVRDPSGASHVLDAAHAREVAATDAWIARRGWCGTAAGAAFGPVAERRDAGRVFAVVRATPRAGVPVELWFDRADGLLDRTVERLNENGLVQHFADYRAVAGTVWPFERRVDDPQDRSTERWTTLAVRARGRPAAAAFAVPPQPRDAWIEHGARSATVPYSTEGQKIIVGVSVDGSGPLPFVLDSGGHFILTSATSRRLRLSPAGAVANTGAGNGILLSGYARVHEVRVGAAVMRDQVANVIPYAFARLERGPRPPKAGWLGLELFERFAVALNPDAHTLTLTPLHEARPVARGIRVPIVFDEDAPLADCTVERVRGTCMIDTGNAGSTIVEGDWLRRNGLTARFAHGIDVGDGVRAARARITLGDLVLPHELVTAYPQAERGSEATTVEAAILSESLNQRYRMTLDYGRHAMWLEPARHPLERPFTRSGFFAVKRPDGAFDVRFVIARSPAAAAGMHAGDRIVAVDGRPAARLSGSDLAALGGGPVGTVRRYRLIARGARGMRTAVLRLADMLP